MELEFFVEPGADEDWHEFLVKNRMEWWLKQGDPRKRLDLYDVPAKERAHYSKSTIDIMYKFPHGTEELEGIANRTDFDLGSHTKNQSDLSISAKVQKNSSSNAKLAIQNKETKGWTVPYVIEPAAGVERGFLAILNEAYAVEKLENGKERTVLSLKPHLSPIKAAVIPLKKNNEELVLAAQNLKKELQGLSLGRILLENSGNIGKSYRRHDEVGTPLCITVDFQTLEDQTVTIRNRDSMDQERVHLEEASPYLQEYLR